MELTLGEHKYEIREIDAETGAFIASRMVNKLRQIISEESKPTDSVSTESKVTPEEAARGTIALIMMNLDESEYKMIQRKVLELVDRYETAVDGVAVPIIRGGRIAIKELKTDVQLLIQLTNESLNANFSRFFIDNGLKLVMTGQL